MKIAKKLLALFLALMLSSSAMLSVSAAAAELQKDDFEGKILVSEEVLDGESKSEPEENANKELELVPEESEEPAEADVQSEDESPMTYEEFFSDLKVLEGYADTYAKEHEGEEEVELVINYIRCGVEKYVGGNWTVLAGEERKEFTNYVSAKDTENGTTASALRNLDTFTIPNGQTVDFAHMFGCMDISYHTLKTNPTAAVTNADLSGWGGDICDLIGYTQGKVSGTVDEMAEVIRTSGNYLGYDDPAPEIHSFGILDMYGDLDGFYIVQNLSGGKSISTIMKSYFNANLSDKFRAEFLLKNRFNGAGTKEEIRSAVYDAYRSNTAISALESSRGLTDIDDLRKACCYAFADYLYNLTGNITDKPSNDYYTVYSSETTNLAPGIVQTICNATAKDGKTLVYYIAVADVSRSDVNVYANYKDNIGGPPWGMARVQDQMQSAKDRHSDPENTETYIPNYAPIVGINADFYNMTNGAPSGALVMEGITYNGVGNEYFFAVLKDGTPIIGGRAEWEANKENIAEAVGANPMLIKDGKIVVGTNGDYYLNRASRTCVGITADNKVVFMVMDGRQEPVSAGGSAIEIAQVMLDAGCVVAVNLDGGGSTTYVAKEEGKDTFEVVNRPSDGYARSVSSSLMIVSTARPSDEFDHAVISADYDYLTVGTSLDIRVTGVSASGNAAAIPDDAEIKVSDETIGTISENVFTAKGLGDVQIQLVSGGKVIGKKTLHVVAPTALKFEKESINATYGVAVNLPLTAVYNGNKVAINANDVMLGFVENNQPVLTSKAGIINGFAFIGNESSGIRSVIIGAALLNNGNPDLNSAVMMTVYMFKSGEASFDFDNATGGDRMLAWKRTVANSKTGDDITYYIDKPGESMDISYTFAVDMKEIPIPEKIKPLMALLPGGDAADATAWNFLLQLAERVSVHTKVEIELQVPQGITIVADKNSLTLANEYFELKSFAVNEETNTLTLVCNFKKQTQAIDPATANSLCILSGLKLIPTDAAAWDENGRLEVAVSGRLGYDIYLRSNAVYGIASNKDNQEKYGIYPYESESEMYNGAPERGAHFYEENLRSFADEYTLDKSVKQGWVQENGKWYYYESNVVLTGIQELPSNVSGESGKFFFDLGTDGASKGKVSGLFTLNDNLYFAENGKRITGWKSISYPGGTVKNYFFNTATYAAVNGSQNIGGYNYVFENYMLVRGDLVTRANGNLWYMWAGSWATQTWHTIDGNKYYFHSSYNAAKGIYGMNIGGVNVEYVFSDEGVWLENFTGIYKSGGYSFWVENGIKNKYPGLVYFEGYYYYFKYNDGNILGPMVKNCTFYTDKTNGLMKAAQYQFDEQGRMINPNPYKGTIAWKNWDGTVLKTESVNYGVTPKYDGVPARENDAQYSYEFKGWTPEIVPVMGNAEYTAEFTQTVNKYTVTWKNGDVVLEKEQLAYGEKPEYKGETPTKEEDTYVYTFSGWEPEIVEVTGDAVYSAVFEKTGKNGLYTDKENNTWWLEDGEAVLDKGLTQVKDENGHNLYYYFAEDGKAVKNVPASGKDYWVEKTNGLLPQWGYYFDEKGIILHDEKFQNGVCEDGEAKYYYIDGIKVHMGMFEQDGYYYYAKSSGALVVNASYYCERTNGLQPEGTYKFDEEGRMILPDVNKNGIYEEDGSLYYYVKGERYYAGLIEIDGSYYYVRTSGEVVHGRSYWITKTNGLLTERSYDFDESGRIILPKNGIVEEDGSLYYYVDGVKNYAGLIEIEGSYYYVRTNGELVRGRSYWVTKTNGLMGERSYEFGEDGKMLKPEPKDNSKDGIVAENGTMFYYKDGVKTYAGLIEIDGSYYYIKTSGEVIHGRKYWISKTNGLMKEGSYTFADDGKMVLS